METKLMNSEKYAHKINNCLKMSKVTILDSILFYQQFKNLQLLIYPFKLFNLNPTIEISE